MTASSAASPTRTDHDERVYSTREGDILLALKDNTVWVSEGFDLPLARKLRESIDQANAPIGSGPVMQARAVPNGQDLIGGLANHLGQFGFLKAALR